MAKPKKHTGWVRLDNAAIIFPASSDREDPKVFRFSCSLRKTVHPGTLQLALDETLKLFPGFLNVLKHGFFWYYLEASELTAKVHPDQQPVCSPLYDQNEVRLLFDVSYHANRINVEVYHAVTDGTGAMQFLQSLVCRYLSLLHPALKTELPEVEGSGASASEKMADSFQKYYDPKKKGRMRPEPSYRIRGTRLSENRLKIVEGILPLDKTLALAKQHKTTLTIYLAAMLICAIHENMSLRERRRPITLSVPVNLRNYFSSASVRNFFGVIYISHQESGEIAFEELLASIALQFREKLKPEALAENLSYMVAMEKNAFIRAIPLALKDLGLRAIYRRTDNDVTAALSNVGKITLPEAFSEHIDYFDVMSSTRKQQVCICSYQNKLVINFTDRFVSADIQKTFFRSLSRQGIDISIVTNPID